MEHSSVCRCRKLWKLTAAYPFKSRLYMHIFQHLFAWILWIFIFFSIISKCIIHVLYLLCCVLSAYLSGRRVPWNIIYRASVYCIPKRNDGPLAKDLPGSRLFTLETVAGWKYARQSTIYHCCTPHREILHHQHWDYKQTRLLLHLCGFCLHSIWIQRQTCGFTAAQCFSNTSVMFQSEESLGDF